MKNMRKLGWFIIGLIFIAMTWTIISLAIPAIGTASHDFFVNFLGQSIVTGATTYSTQIMLWGSTGFLPAFAIFLADGVAFLVIGIVFTKFVWSKRPGWLGNTPKPAVTAPLQSQLNTPDLYVPKTQAQVPLATTPRIEQPKAEEKTA